MMLADVLWNNACLPSYHLFHRHRWHLETLCNLISFSRKYSCCVELLAVRSAYISIFTSQPHCLHLWVKLGWNLIETEMCQGICFLTTSSLLRHTYHSCYKNEPLYTIWQRQFTFYLHVYIMYTWKKGVIILTLCHCTILLSIISVFVGCLWMMIWMIHHTKAVSSVFDLQIRLRP